MKRGLAAALVLVFALGGCSTLGPKEEAGTLLGGLGGAIIGSQFGGGSGRLVGVAIGTLAGAMIGQDVGRSLDRLDRLQMENTAQQALEYNRTDQPAAWRNPDTGHSGTVTPRRTWKEPSGRYCREYTQTVMIGGEEEQAYGTACRRPDGKWEIVK